MEPLKVELVELEQLIKDQQDKICAIKSNILKNEEKIQKMVTGINFSSRTWNEKQGAQEKNFPKMHWRSTDEVFVIQNNGKTIFLGDDMS